MARLLSEVERLDYAEVLMHGQAARDPQLFVATLVTRYPPGAGIGWHRDAPMFGPNVVGISLASPCSMRFRRRAVDVRRTYVLVPESRSEYVLAGAARWSCQHSITATPALRYSVPSALSPGVRRPGRHRRPPRQRRVEGSATPFCPSTAAAAASCGPCGLASAR